VRRNFYENLLKHSKSLSAEDTYLITAKRLMELDKIEQYCEFLKQYLPKTFEHTFKKFNEHIDTNNLANETK
jgi:hypothetical protein